jgi:hypothetical protein
MPRLHPQLQDCVFFLYRVSPKTGKIEGPLGTGFFVAKSYPFHPQAQHLYAVSNWHVAVSLGASMIRVNTKDGTTRFLDYDPMDWIFDRSEDLAIVDVHDDLRPNDGISRVHERDFLAGDRWSRSGLTIAEHTFMIGLFPDHHGGDWNVPSARFGNISMLSSLHAKVKMPGGSEQACYLVDTHSKGGFSGSPVFVYGTSGSDLSKLDLDERDPFGIPKPTNVLFGLLGIHCGQFWENVEVRKTLPIYDEANNDPILEGDRLKVPSSMTIVLPAWRILALLDVEQFAVARKKREDRY